MCGIFAYILNDTQVKGNDELKKEFNKIQHRGPDHSGIETIEKLDNVKGYTVGCHRLAIVGSKKGNQPITKKGVTLVCNGQIYNFNDLSKQFPEEKYQSDCEIIIDLYLKYGIKCCQLIDGVFAFVLIHNDNIYVARDFVGVRPLFYGMNERGDIVAFASEFKSINWCDKVEVFPPSSIWVKNDGKGESKCYKYKEIVDVKITIDSQQLSTVQNNVRSLITNAIYKRVVHSNKPVGFLLSGGIDSSLVLTTVYNMLKSVGRESMIRVFSMRYDNPNAIGQDYQYARMLTEQLGVKHDDVKFTTEDIFNCLDSVIYHIESYDPNTIRASIPMFLLAKYISEKTNYKVILSGEGADELFMGYSYFSKTNDNCEANEESRRLIRNLHQFDLLRADRCMSAFGLDIRVPFLDRYLVEYVSSLSGKYKKYQNGEEKHLLRETFRHEEGYDVLNRLRILDRQKEKFSDGVGFNYVPRLIEKGKEFCKNYSDWKSIYVENPPKTEEEFMYRTLFEKHYKGKQNVITKRYLPSWCKQTSSNVPVFIN